MSAFKNWILPVLAVILAILEGSFDIIQMIVNEFSLGPKYVAYIRIAIVVIGAVMLKLQAPSLEKSRIAKLGHHPKV